jgi:hypothetical protein
MDNSCITILRHLRDCALWCCRPTHFRKSSIEQHTQWHGNHTYWRFIGYKLLWRDLNVIVVVLLLCFACAWLCPLLLFIAYDSHDEIAYSRISCYHHKSKNDVIFELKTWSTRARNFPYKNIILLSWGWINPTCHSMGISRCRSELSDGLTNNCKIFTYRRPLDLSNIFAEVKIRRYGLTITKLA